VFNFGAQPPIHRKNSKISKQILQDHYQHTLIRHHDLKISYIRDEIKKLGQRYADRLEEHPDTLAIDLMSDAETPRRLKKKLSQDLCT